MAEHEPTEPAAPTTLLQRLIMLRPGEARPLLWSVAGGYLLFTAQFIVRPLRETFGIERGADKLPGLITATLIAMLLATPIFGWLVSRLPRRRFIPIAYRFFLVNMLIFFALVRWKDHLPDLGEGHPLTVGNVFYVWYSIFNLFVVSVFWGLMADVWSSGQSKRLFGLIGVGATVGVICGSAFTALLVGSIGHANLLLVSAVLLEGSALCLLRVAACFGLTAKSAPTPEPGPGALAGLRAVARSPYLLAICGYMLVYTVCSTFLYLKVGEVVSATIADRGQRTAFYAQISLWSNILTLVTQIFLTGRLVRSLGVGITLTAVPLVTIAGFVVLGRAEAWGLALLPTVFAFNVARNWTNYAVSRPSREMLYAVLTPDEKYKAKPFIDTFVYRGGDAIGAWAPSWLARAGIAMWSGAVVIGAVGLGLGLLLGVMRARKDSPITSNPTSGTAPPSGPHRSASGPGTA